MSKCFCITIDTEPDCDIHWRRADPACFDSVLVGIRQLLRPIWDKYAVKPVYFLSPEVVENDDCCRAVQKEIQLGAEIGTHLHPEYIEPLKKYERFAGTNADEYPCFAYSRQIELEKIANLTNLIAKRLGVQPASYRAGRFGADLDTIECLKQLTYKIDSSVTPEINWSYKKGPDHSRSPKQPYFIGANNYYSAGNSPILEIPLTISGKRRFFPVSRWTSYRWLRPSVMTFTEMKSLITEFTTEYEEPVLNMMFHSMEVILKKTPFVRTAIGRRLYLARLEKTIRYMRENGFESKTLLTVYNEKRQQLFEQDQISLSLRKDYYGIAKPVTAKSK